MLNNDFFGDGRDRWRSASYSFSNIFEVSSERFPSLNKYVWELRGRGEIITPDRITVPFDPNDRPYAGYSGVALLGHLVRPDRQITFGAELGLLGPQNGISTFHERAHRRLNLQIPRGWNGQIGNRVVPTAIAEAVWERTATSGRLDLRFRPYVSAQAGLESFVRTGFDLVLGRSVADNFYVRDTVTGHLQTARRDRSSAGINFVLGADIAYVAASMLLPSRRGIQHERLRPRLRSGVQVEYGRAQIFGGVTWLGEEFKQQPEAQILGSLSIRLAF